MLEKLLASQMHSGNQVAKAYFHTLSFMFSSITFVVANTRVFQLKGLTCPLVKQKRAEHIQACNSFPQPYNKHSCQQNKANER